MIINVIVNIIVNINVIVNIIDSDAITCIAFSTRVGLRIVMYRTTHCLP